MSTHTEDEDRFLSFLAVFCGLLSVPTNERSIRQLNTLARSFTLESKSESLLGRTALEKAKVSQWLSYCAFSKYFLSVGSLSELDDALASRSFLAGGPAATLADAMIFFLSYQVASKELKHARGLVHFSRWFDQMQQVNGVARTPFPILSTFRPASVLLRTNRFGFEPMVLSGANISDASAVFGATKVPSSVFGATKTDPPLEKESKKAIADKKKEEPKKEKSDKKTKAPKKKDDGKPKEKKAACVSMVDLRVGQIVKVWEHPDSEKLFCEEIDVGEDKHRQIASGLREFYKLEDLQDRKIIVVCNLKARKLANFKSEGMVLCGSNADHTVVEFVDPPAGSKIGEQVTFEGFVGDVLSPSQMAKQKAWEGVQPDFSISAEGVAVWKAAPFSTSAGICKVASLKAGVLS